LREVATVEYPPAANISIMIQILAVNITQTEPKRKSSAANKPEPTDEVWMN